MADKLIEYTNLLHKHGSPDADAVKKFLAEKGKDDPKFQERAKKLNALFRCLGARE